MNVVLPVPFSPSITMISLSVNSPESTYVTQAQVRVGIPLICDHDIHKKSMIQLERMLGAVSTLASRLSAVRGRLGAQSSATWGAPHLQREVAQRLHHRWVLVPRKASGAVIHLTARLCHLHTRHLWSTEAGNSNMVVCTSLLSTSWLDRKV